MKRKDTTTKREAMQALEAMCLGLAIWRASKDSAVEERCFKEIERLADQIYRTMTPKGHLTVQMGIEQLLKEHEEKCQSDADIQISTQTEDVGPVDLLTPKPTESLVPTLRDVSKSPNETGS